MCLHSQTLGQIHRHTLARRLARSHRLVKTPALLSKGGQLFRGRAMATFLAKGKNRQRSFHRARWGGSKTHKKGAFFSPRLSFVPLGELAVCPSPLPLPSSLFPLAFAPSLSRTFDRLSLKVWLRFRKFFCPCSVHNTLELTLPSTRHSDFRV